MHAVMRRKAPLHLHARAALTAGLSTLVPIPFADDWVAERARSNLIEELLKHHGRRASPKDFSALHEDVSSWLTLPFRLLGKLVLLPLRTVTIVLGVRSVTLMVAHTLELGRTLDRWLAEGRFGDALDPDERVRQTKAARKAFEEAFEGTDRRVLRHALAHALRFARKQKARIEQGLAPVGLERAVDDVESALSDPELKPLFDAFDEKVDAALARHLDKQR
jgi:uncharacterized protein (DUF697 family)